MRQHGISDHFADVSKMIELGKGGQYKIDEQGIDFGEAVNSLAFDHFRGVRNMIESAKYGLLKTLMGGAANNE